LLTARRAFLTWKLNVAPFRVAERLNAPSSAFQK
jgi:hypothetical protein